MSKKRLIIIGSGMTGITLASNLDPEKFEIQILDKGRGVGGRMASKTIFVNNKEFRYDYGAQFFTVRSKEFGDQVSEWEMKKLVKVWCNGFENNDGHNRYMSTNGMRDLLGNISSGLKIQQNQKVAKIEYFDDYWRLGTNRANFESELLVITIPLPQCVELLKTIPTFDHHDSLDEIKKIEYKKCIALIMTMGSESNFDPPGAYQMMDQDWDFVSDNKIKGISPNTCVTAHASNALSERLWNDDEAKIKDQLVDKIKNRFNIKPEHSFLHKWFYAQSKKNLEGYFRKIASYDNRLFLAGEVFGGSKIEGAYLSGYHLAKYMNNQY